MYVYDMDIANDLLDVLADHTAGLHHYIPIRNRLRATYGAAQTSPLHALSDAIEHHIAAEERKVGAALAIADMWMDGMDIDAAVLEALGADVMMKMDDLTTRCLSHAMFLKRHASGETAWSRCRELVEEYATRM